MERDIAQQVESETQVQDRKTAAATSAKPTTVPTQPHAVESLLDSVGSLVESELNQGQAAANAKSESLATPDVSVIVPVRNRCTEIGPVVDELLALKLNAEVIVVDDASDDGTRDILYWLEGTPRVHYLPKPLQEGRGASLLVGFQQAASDILVVQNPSLDYSISALPMLVEPVRMGRADAVYGARQWEGAATKGATDRWRRKALRHGLKLTCGIQIEDVLTGQKVFRKHLVAGLPLVQRGDGVDLELTVKFSRLHADILELPVPFGPPVTQSPSRLDGKRVDTRLGTRAMLSHLGALTRATIGM